MASFAPRLLAIAHSLGVVALLAGCAETTAVTNSVSNTVSSATNSALSGVGQATGTRLGPEAVEGLPVSGTVTLRATQAAHIGSGTTGSGTLTFDGKAYPFRLTGLGVGGLGVSSIRAKGDVFNLASPEQFAGTYGQVRSGVAVANASSGTMWLQNEAGVIMRLQARRSGLMLALGVDAIVITLR